MARRVSDYRIRRIADRGNEEDGPDSRARGDRFYHNRRSADRGNEKVDRNLGNISVIKGLRRRVDIDEGERLFLEQALRWIPEGVPMARNDGSIFTFDDIERNEGEKGLVEGDGPTVVTGGPVAFMVTLSFMPKVQVGLLVEARFTNLNLEGDLIKSPITVGSPINFKWQNQDNIVVAKNTQRKEAIIWLDKEPSRSILTWEDLVSKFINQVLPSDRSWQLRKFVLHADPIIVIINVHSPEEGMIIRSFMIISNNFKPQLSRKGDEASNGVMEPHKNNDTVNFGLYVKNDFFNKIGLVDYGPQDQMGRKDYEGPTTTSLDVLNSLSSKFTTTKCVGAELFERFKLIAKSDRSNAPYDPGGIGLIPGNLKMLGNEDHHRQGRRFAAGGNGHDGRDPRDVEIERFVNGIADRGNEEDGPDSRARGDRFYHNRRSADRGNEKVDCDPWNISEIKGLRRRVRDLEIQHEIRQIWKRIRELKLQQELTKETESEPIIWDIEDEEEEYPFVNNMELVNFILILLQNVEDFVSKLDRLLPFLLENELCSMDTYPLASQLSCVQELLENHQLLRQHVLTQLLVYKDRSECISLRLHCLVLYQHIVRNVNAIEDIVLVQASVDDP
nr:reverse transcriptase domain-containing protein [Tanacetum cinerariifolium]